jgi:hypothetical protein
VFGRAKIGTEVSDGSTAQYRAPVEQVMANTQQGNNGHVHVCECMCCARACACVYVPVFVRPRMRLRAGCRTRGYFRTRAEPGVGKDWWYGQGSPLPDTGHSTTVPQCHTRQSQWGCVAVEATSKAVYAHKGGLAMGQVANGPIHLPNTHTREAIILRQRTNTRTHHPGTHANHRDQAVTGMRATSPRSTHARAHATACLLV